MGLNEGIPSSVLPDHAGRADYLGSFVNMAARFASAAAHGGQIALPEETAIRLLMNWDRLHQGIDSGTSGFSAGSSHGQNSGGVGQHAHAPHSGGHATNKSPPSSRPATRDLISAAPEGVAARGVQVGTIPDHEAGGHGSGADRRPGSQQTASDTPAAAAAAAVAATAEVELVIAPRVESFSRFRPPQALRSPPMAAVTILTSAATGDASQGYQNKEITPDGSDSTDSRWQRGTVQLSGSPPPKLPPPTALPPRSLPSVLAEPASRTGSAGGQGSVHSGLQGSRHSGFSVSSDASHGFAGPPHSASSPGSQPTTNPVPHYLPPLSSAIGDPAAVLVQAGNSSGLPSGDRVLGARGATPLTSSAVGIASTSSLGRGQAPGSRGLAVLGGEESRPSSVCRGASFGTAGGGGGRAAATPEWQHLDPETVAPGAWLSMAAFKLGEFT